MCTKSMDPFAGWRESCPTLFLGILDLVRSLSQTYWDCCNRFISNVYEIDGPVDSMQESCPALYLRILDLVMPSNQTYWDCCNRFDSHVNEIDRPVDAMQESCLVLFSRTLGLVWPSSETYWDCFNIFNSHVYEIDGPECGRRVKYIATAVIDTDLLRIKLMDDEMEGEIDLAVLSLWIIDSLRSSN